MNLKEEKKRKCSTFFYLNIIERNIGFIFTFNLKGDLIVSLVFTCKNILRGGIN